MNSIKNYLIFSLLIGLISSSVWTFFSSREEYNACCSIDEFVAFANDKQFVNAHEKPLLMDFTPQYGEMKTLFLNKEGDSMNVFMINAKKPTGKYLFVFHEWWGLNDYIKRESEKYYEALGKNVNIIALDLYNGQTASTPERAMALMKSVDTEKAKELVAEVMAYAEEQAKMEAKDRFRYGTIGWCFGGGWSLQASLLPAYAKQAVACVIYYGMPEKDEEKLKTLSAPVLGIFPTKDKWITPQVVNEFEASMNKINKSITVYNYVADHAFANPSNPNYDSEATKDATKKTIKFLKKNLK